MKPRVGLFVTWHSPAGDEVAMITGVSKDPTTGIVAVDLTAFPRGGPPEAITSALEGSAAGHWSGPGKKKAKHRKPGPRKGR